MRGGWPLVMGLSLCLGLSDGIQFVGSVGELSIHKSLSSIHIYICYSSMSHYDTNFIHSAFCYISRVKYLCVVSSVLPPSCNWRVGIDSMDVSFLFSLILPLLFSFTLTYATTTLQDFQPFSEAAVLKTCTWKQKESDNHGDGLLLGSNYAAVSPCVFCLLFTSAFKHRRLFSSLSFVPTPFFILSISPHLHMLCFYIV